MILMLAHNFVTNNPGKAQLVLWMIERGILERGILPTDLNMAFQIYKGDSLKTVLFDR